MLASLKDAGNFEVQNLWLNCKQICKQISFLCITMLVFSSDAFLKKMFLKRIPCITDFVKVLVTKVLLFLLKNFCFLDYCVFSTSWKIWENICVFPTLHLWYQSRLWGKHRTFIIKWIKLAVFGGTILKYIFGVYAVIVWKYDNFFFNTFCLERPTLFSYD